MEMDTLLSYMSQYGLLLVAVIIFLEYLNLPGFPAGIIMPAAGVWIANSKTNFIVALVVSIMSALVASWIMYGIGRYFGDAILRKCKEKLPKQRENIERQMNYLKEKGWLWVLVSKVIPVARTIVPIPAGMLKIEFWKYTAASIIGITIWNTAFIASGYFFWEQVVNKG